MENENKATSKESNGLIERNLTGTSTSNTQKSNTRVVHSGAQSNRQPTTPVQDQPNPITNRSDQRVTGKFGKYDFLESESKKNELKIYQKFAVKMQKFWCKKFV